MIKSLYFILLCAMINVGAQSQNATQRLYVGIDLFRSLPTYFQSGYTIEPALIFKTKNDFLIDLAVGYTSISKDTIHKNIHYLNEGRYVKLGARKIFGKHFSVGLSMGYTSFTETGVIKFAGTYFPDVILNKGQSNAMLFIEPTLSYEIPLSPKFSLITQFRTSYAFSKLREPEFPVYSAPGFGYVFFLGSGNIPASLGISVRLVYKIFNKE